MKKTILLVLLTMLNINALFAQESGIYKILKDTAKAENPSEDNSLYEIVGKSGRMLFFEPYIQRSNYSGKDRIRFRINPKMKDSGVDTECLQESANPPEVEDFINCLSKDFTSDTNKILGVWYYEISGVKCYKIYAPTRSLLMFIYERSDGTLETANAILEAVNYGKNKVVAEEGTRYSITFKDNDTIIVSYIVEGKKHQEKWARSAFPVYFLDLF